MILKFHGSSSPHHVISAFIMSSSRRMPPAASPPAADGYDEDGVRERLDIRESDAARRRLDAASREAAERARAAEVAKLLDGKVSMADFARLAREAGMPAAEVARALKARAADERRAAEVEAEARARREEGGEGGGGGGGGEGEGEEGEGGEALAAARAKKAEGLALLRGGDARGGGEAFCEAAALAAACGAARLRCGALLNEALCWLKAEEWEAAAAACDKVLAARADEPKALYRRAQARRRLGDLPAAKADLVLAAALLPHDKDVRRALREVREELKPPPPAATPRQQEGAEPKPPAAEARPPPEAPRVDVSKRSYAHMSFSIDGVRTDRLVLQLFDDLTPTTAANFRAFCGEGVPLAGEARRYEGCRVHRIVAGFVVQTGDVLAGDGSGCLSVVGDGGAFADESFAVPHSRSGILSMANMGKNSNGCQFFFTLAPAPQLDKKHVAFGRVLHGHHVLRQLEALPTDQADAPFQAVAIAACGEMSRDEATRAASADPRAPLDDAAEAGGAVDMAGEAMVAAALRGDVQLVRSLVQKGISVDAFGSVEDSSLSPGEPVERSALAVAAACANLTLTQGLLSAGADPNLPDSCGATPLHLAVRALSRGCAHALLEASADVSLRASDGKAAVHWAAADARAADCLLLLLERDPSQHRLECSGLQPLHVAAAADNAAAILALLRAGASISCMAAGELTPLQLAAAQGCLSALATLLAAGAEVNARGERSSKTALHRACEHSRHAAVAALLAAKADAAALDSRGSTALHWAAKSGCHEAVGALLSAGVLADAASSGGSVPLHLACEAGSAQCVAVLLRANAAVDAADAHGVTPLHAASASGHLECAQLLLAQRADPNLALQIGGRLQVSAAETEHHSKTPLYLAAEKGHAPIVRVLLAAGADPQTSALTTTGAAVTRTSALWAARRAHHDAVAQLLVEAGAEEIAETSALPL